jgi:hypothetical protein
MKILYIINTLSSGGAELQLLTLCRRLKALGVAMGVAYLKRGRGGASPPSRFRGGRDPGVQPGAGRGSGSPGPGFDCIVWSGGRGPISSTRISPGRISWDSYCAGADSRGRGSAPCTASTPNIGAGALSFPSFGGSGIEQTE